MTALAAATAELTTPFRGLFPDWDPRRPVAWYFAENLLEARARSAHPTNRDGWDEDVNMYLVGLLCRPVAADPRAGVLPGTDPALLVPEGSRGRHDRARHYARQADHRLLALGLWDRGDLVRRHGRAWHLTADATRERDVALTAACYALAAGLVDPTRPDLRALADVWGKLARQTDVYVHVLQTLARRRLGLGARLDDAALARLMATAGQNRPGRASAG